MTSENGSLLTMDDWETVPLRALNVAGRLQLSQFLNAEQVVMTAKGLARDYRGVAELMGFSYSEVRNHQRSADPTRSLLEAYLETAGHGGKGPTFANLASMLVEIGRFDVIDDMTDYLNADAAKYKSNPEAYNNKTPARPLLGQESHHLTIDDVLNPNQVTLYDAYVCYADADYDFVVTLAQFLESERVGLKLFVRDRDSLSGTLEFDTFTQLIETRCNRMLLILSPAFIESEEHQMQTRYANSIAVEMRQRKLVPLIYKQCQNLPTVVRLLTKIDFTHGKPAWIWTRLVDSIKAPAAKQCKLSIAQKCRPQIAIEPPTAEPLKIEPAETKPSKIELPLTEPVAIRPVPDVEQPPSPQRSKKVKAFFSKMMRST